MKVITAHELARKLLELPDLPVVTVDGEMGQQLVWGDGASVSVQDAEFAFDEDMEPDPDKPQKRSLFDGQFHTVLRLKKDAPEKRQVVVIG